MENMKSPVDFLSEMGGMLIFQCKNCQSYEVRISENGDAITCESCGSGWKNNEKAFCKDCGKDYTHFNLDIVFPDNEWEQISGEKQGLLCAQCIVNRVANLESVTRIDARLGYSAKPFQGEILEAVKEMGKPKPPPDREIRERELPKELNK